MMLPFARRNRMKNRAKAEQPKRRWPRGAHTCAIR
jgi:hypothetical protein